MPFIILLLLIAFILFDISILIGAIGVGSSILLSLFTTALGIFLVKLQGFETLRNAQAQMAQGKTPAIELAEGMALLMAGILLLIPGFITDTIGFCCLVPSLRRAVIKWLAKNGVIRAAGQAKSYQQNTADNQPNSGNVIEGEYKSRD